MLNLPHKIRKEIAPLVENQALKALLQMEPEALDKQLEIQGDRLEAQGHGPKVIRAYQEIGPLLLENRALMTFLGSPENSELRGALPDVASVGEALILAQREYRMSETEVKELQPMLERMLNA